MPTEAAIQRCFVIFLKNLTKFTGKTPVLEFHLIKVAALAYSVTKKETLAQVVFCEVFEIFQNTRLQNTSALMLLDQFQTAILESFICENL